MSENGTVIENLDDFAKWLKLMKKKHKICLCDIAEFSGLSKKSVWQYAKGTHCPSMDSVFRILDTFDKRIIIVDKEENNE